MLDGIGNKFVDYQDQRIGKFRAYPAVAHDYREFYSFREQLSQIGLDAHKQRFRAYQILPTQLVEFCMKR